FRRAMANVQRMQPTQRTPWRPVLADAPDILRQRREHAVGKDQAPLATLSDGFMPAEPSEGEGHFLRPNHGPDVIKNLKLGKWPIQASLDLHGATLEDARERLDRFLHSCITH